MAQRGDTIYIARYLVSGAESSSLYLEVGQYMCAHACVQCACKCENHQACVAMQGKLLLRNASRHCYMVVVLRQSQTQIAAESAASCAAQPVGDSPAGYMFSLCSYLMLPSLPLSIYCIGAHQDLPVCAVLKL